MRRGWVGGLVVLAALVITQPSGADSSKRQQLIDDINRLLSDIAGELRDVPSDSGTSDLDRTVDYASKVSDKARELVDQTDGDSSAKEIANRYPDIARRYQDAARSLHELKNNYRRIDEWPKKCEQTARELADRLRPYTDTNDPRGFEEVGKLATETAKVGKEAIETAERAKNEMYTWNDKVNGFSDSDGKWSDVRSNLSSASRSMYEYTVAKQELIKRDDACGNLAKEERNPQIEQARTKLSEGKRGVEAIYTALDRQLTDMASNLDGLAGDSDDSDVTNAERKLDEVDKLIDQLDRVKGNDGEARRRVELYRNLTRAGRVAMQQLHTLKQSQFRVDKAPDKCRDAEATVDAAIKEFVPRRDPRGVSEIPLRARNIAAPLKESLAKSDELHVQLERALSEALRFDPSEGRWRSVAEKSKASANAIWEYWKRARDAAHKACDELAKGDESASVKRALAELGKSRSDNQTELDRIRADQGKWYDQVKELRAWYKQDTEAVRQGFCTLQESVGDYDEGTAYIQTLETIADRMASRLSPRWSELTRTSAELITRLKRLEAENDPDVKASSTKLREQIERTERSMYAVMSTELRGRDDAEFRTFITVGMNEHKRIQADRGKCDVSEITIPGEGKRMDCVRVSSGTCYIVEIKPNNDAAIRKGRQQLFDYQEAIKRLFEAKKADLDSAFTDKLSIFKQCVSNGRIQLETEFVGYDFCPPDGKLFNDFVVP